MSKYRAFSVEEAISFAKTLPGLFPDNAQLTSEEIGDGNLNLVFRIRDSVSGQSIIFKQALPYAKVVGESWPLTLDRARIESEALLEQAKWVPHLVPKVFHYDEIMALTVMEDLSDHVIMRKGLMDGGEYPYFAGHISTFLAETLFHSTDLGMDQQAKKLLQKRFVNPELCKITEDLIFDHPYFNADTNHFENELKSEVDRIWNNQSLHFEVALLREKFLTQSQALLHGDLHTGSIFVTPESTKVIDPEFAFYGPIGFDIGAIFANLLMNAAAQSYWSDGQRNVSDVQNQLLNTISDIWVQFEQKFVTLWNEKGVDRLSKTPGFQSDYLSRLLMDTFGYTGCKMVRRVIGLAHVADLDKMPIDNQRIAAKLAVLHLGQQFILHHRNARSISEMIDMSRAALGTLVHT